MKEKAIWMIANDIMSSLYQNTGRIYAPAKMKIFTTFFGYSKNYNYMGKHVAFGDFAKATKNINAMSLIVCCALNLYQVVKTARTDNPIKRANERGFALQ